MARWLKTVRSMYGLTQNDLAQYLGKTRSAVSMYEADLSPIPIEDIAKIRSAFVDAPPPPKAGEDLQVKATLTMESRAGRIRYAGVVPAASQWGDPLTGTEDREIDAKFTGPNRFLCAVEGDSCWPALHQGDLTVWESLDAPPPPGLIVLAERIMDQACTVKELRVVNGRTSLTPVNPDYEEPFDAEGWKVRAKLVGVLSSAEGPEETWYSASGLRADYLVRKRG